MGGSARGWRKPCGRVVREESSDVPSWKQSIQLRLSAAGGAVPRGFAGTLSDGPGTASVWGSPGREQHRCIPAERDQAPFLHPLLGRLFQNLAPLTI